jgi:tagatose-1,6-bisphosphate aldolase
MISLLPALGVIRGLDACALPSGKFVLLSIDVRNRLREDLNPSHPELVTADEMVAFKRSVVAALGPAASGSLLDPEMGAAQCLVDATQPGQRGLVVALEATGYDGPPTDRRSRALAGWTAEKARRLGASAAKVLLYFHPDAPSADAQVAFLEAMARQCHALELPLFVEALVFSPDTGGNLAGTERSDAIIRTAQRLSPVGGDVYMAQFPGDPAHHDEMRWADACERLTAACSGPWILLAGPADYSTYEVQTTVATSAGASGILAGKTVWGEALAVTGDDRAEFLASESRQRIERLTTIVEERAAPWRERRPDLVGARFAADWYRDY